MKARVFPARSTNHVRNTQISELRRRRELRKQRILLVVLDVNVRAVTLPIEYSFVSETGSTQTPAARRVESLAGVGSENSLRPASRRAAPRAAFAGVVPCFPCVFMYPRRKRDP